MELLQQAGRRPPRRAGDHDHRARLGRERGRGGQAGRVRLRREAVRPGADPAGGRQGAEDPRAVAARPAARRRPGPRGRFRLVGDSPAIRQIYAIIEKVADTPSTVLITGESGTGKELIARALHENSSRHDGPFIKINCAAIPKTLMESELFGYEKGAFTGAVGAKPGRFELADGGTLFLDEIGEIPVEMQVKLLRVLQESEFERVGGIKTIKVDVRLVAATNRDLAAELADRRLPRGPLLPAQRGADPPAAAARAARGHPAAGRATSSPSSTSACARRSPASSRRRSSGWSRTTGRATSASSRTSSSGPCCSARAA